MVRNWSSPALADLRSRMAVTLADRTSASSVWIAANSVGPAMRGHGWPASWRRARRRCSARASSCSPASEQQDPSPGGREIVLRAGTAAALRMPPWTTRRASTNPTDRRSEEPDISEVFSPEYLAMLVICGGTVRDSDWDLLPEAVAARRPQPVAQTTPAGRRATPTSVPVAAAPLLRVGDPAVLRDVEDHAFGVAELLLVVERVLQVPAGP